MGETPPGSRPGEYGERQAPRAPVQIRHKSGRHRASSRREGGQAARQVGIASKTGLNRSSTTTGDPQVGPGSLSTSRAGVVSTQSPSDAGESQPPERAGELLSIVPMQRGLLFDLGLVDQQ